MPSINLLPWREAERQKRQRDFGVAMGGAVLAGIAVIMLTMLFYSQLISAQESRNNRLKAEIAILEESIKENDRKNVCWRAWKLLNNCRRAGRKSCISSMSSFGSCRKVFI